MTRLAFALALAAVLAPAAPVPETPRVTRTALAAVEKRFDRAIPALDVNDPYDLLGTARGVYLPGCGAIFTTELNLVVSVITPFVPAITQADIDKLHAKKLGRLVSLKRYMRDMMVTAATALDAVPPNEQIVFGVTLFYRNFEIKEGLPGQVIMQAPRQALLDYKAGRIDSAELDSLIRTQEL